MQHLLLVDDEPIVLRALERLLGREGYAVQTAASGDEAIGWIRHHHFDVIVSDVRMPGTDGLELLRTIRDHDLDVPVILITGSPDLESATKAIEYGAFRYLTKPVDGDELRQAVAEATHLHAIARIKRMAIELLGISSVRSGDLAGTHRSFQRGLESLWMAYQPVVNARDNQIIGYEAFVRTREPTIPSPEEFFKVAEHLGCLPQLGRAIRGAFAGSIDSIPADMDLFLNVHAVDLRDDDLLTPPAFADLAHRVVLEVSDHDLLDRSVDLRGRVQALKEAGFRIALAHLGTGQAGLSNFELLAPEMVKIDKSLIRGLDQEPRQRSIVESMVVLTNDMRITPIAEGVETTAERDALIKLGCVIHQGYLFGVPS